MHVVVLGATGNVGSAVMRALGRDRRVEFIAGVARRPPRDALAWPGSEKMVWRALDISCDHLEVLRGADVVVHLAWLIQPSRDEQVMRATNVRGTRRVVDAMLQLEVPRLVYASSVGAYAPSTKRIRRDEGWPATGVSTSTYSRHKAEVEAMLDEVEAARPSLAIARMRTSLVFQRSAAAEIHRLFLGRLLPWHLPRAMRLVPRTPNLEFQATHADDIADAYVRAIHSDATGAFNVAAEGVLDASVIADATGGRTVRMSESLVRGAMAASYAARLQPSEPGWWDMASQTPLMDTTRVRDELGWSEQYSSTEALLELLEGIGDGAGGLTPALAPRHAARPTF